MEKSIKANGKIITMHEQSVVSCPDCSVEQKGIWNKISFICKYHVHYRVIGKAPDVIKLITIFNVFSLTTLFLYYVPAPYLYVPFLGIPKIAEYPFDSLAISILRYDCASQWV
jgi:hypothetical protein